MLKICFKLRVKTYRTSYLIIFKVKYKTTGLDSCFRLLLDVSGVKYQLGVYIF